MPKIFYNPPLDFAYKTFATLPAGPHHGMIGRAHYLEQLEWVPTDDITEADIVHVTGVVFPGHRVDVHTVNAVWPTHLNPSAPQWWFEQNNLMKRTAQKAKRVVVFSRYTAALADELLDTEPVIIPQAFDPDEWDKLIPTGWRLRYGIAPDEPMALWPKTVADWLRDPGAAVHLAAERPEVHVFLMADPDNVTAWVGRVLPPNVHCVGILPFEQYQTLVNECDVYLATTLESASNSQIEAMYMGKPVLGYAWGSAEEMTLGPRPAGVLVQHGDINAFVDAWADVWRKRKSFGRNAHKRAKAHSWEKIAPEYVKLYEGILDER